MKTFEEEHQRYMALLTPAQRRNVEVDPQYKSALQSENIAKIGEIVTAMTCGNATLPRQVANLKKLSKSRKLVNEMLRD